MREFLLREVIELRDNGIDLGPELQAVLGIGDAVGLVSRFLAKDLLQQLVELGAGAELVPTNPAARLIKATNSQSAEVSRGIGSCSMTFTEIDVVTRWRAR